MVAAGLHGSLPPVRGHTDAEGRWRLGRISAPSLHVEVERLGAERWSGEAKGDCQRSGIIDVRL